MRRRVPSVDAAARGARRLDLTWTVALIVLVAGAALLPWLLWLRRRDRGKLEQMRPAG
jgi:Flp pilus assembly protein TadB